MSAAVVGAFTWPDLPNLSTAPHAIVRLTWYCSLVLGIGAVAIGVQQSVFLIRIGCLPIANQLCIDMLSYDTGGGRRTPRGIQVILWQSANGLLEFSIYTWLAGFVVFIWGATRIGQPLASTSDQIVRIPLPRPASVTAFDILHAGCRLFSSVLHYSCRAIFTEHP